MENEIIELKKGIAISLNYIGNIYSAQGDIPKAMEYWRKSLKIYEEIGDKKGIVAIYNQHWNYL